MDNSQINVDKLADLLSQICYKCDVDFSKEELFSSLSIQKPVSNRKPTTAPQKKATVSSKNKNVESPSPNEKAVAKPATKYMSQSEYLNFIDRDGAFGIRDRVFNNHSEIPNITIEHLDSVPCCHRVVRGDYLGWYCGNKIYPNDEYYKHLVDNRIPCSNINDMLCKSHNKAFSSAGNKGDKAKLKNTKTKNTEILQDSVSPKDALKTSKEIEVTSTDKFNEFFAKESVDDIKKNIINNRIKKVNPETLFYKKNSDELYYYFPRDSKYQLVFEKLDDEYVCIGKSTIPIYNDDEDLESDYINCVDMDITNFDDFEREFCDINKLRINV